MHREQHNEGKSKKWLWITLTVAVIVLVGISAYLAGQLSSVKKEASSAKSADSSKVISSSSDNDSDTNNDEDTNNDTDDNNNTDENTNKADKNNDSTDDNGDIAQRIGSLKAMSVCACLLVQPDWFKTTNVTYSENGQQGIIRDSDGNMVIVKYNSVDCVTITTRNAHNAEGKTIQVTPDTLYNDYYNTRKKQVEVNGYVNNLN